MVFESATITNSTHKHTHPKIARRALFIQNVYHSRHSTLLRCALHAFYLRTYSLFSFFCSLSRVVPSFFPGESMTVESQKRHKSASKTRIRNNSTTIKNKNTNKKRNNCTQKQMTVVGAASKPHDVLYVHHIFYSYYFFIVIIDVLHFNIAYTPSIYIRVYSHNFCFVCKLLFDCATFFGGFSVALLLILAVLLSFYFWHVLIARLSCSIPMFFSSCFVLAQKPNRYSAITRSSFFFVVFHCRALSWF